MSQWQSLCLALVVSIGSASTASPQASPGGVEIQSGDVWLLPGDRASPIVVVPPLSAGRGELPTGDVWLSPEHQTIPAVAAEAFQPGDAAVTARSESTLRRR
jgi:hypothetical protein